VWQTDSGIIRSSHGSGTSWSAPETLSAGEGTCVRPFITWDGGQADAVWTSGTETIEHSSNTGSGWSAAEVIIAASAVDGAALARTSEGKLWAVYGCRGEDLQWDLWASTPDPVGVEEGDSPNTLAMSVSGANPFPGCVSLDLLAPEGGLLRIYDLTGRVQLELGVDSGPFTWNSCSSAGTGVQPGLYFAVLSDGASTVSCRLMKLP
jgi:hypothetical protein